MHQTRSNSINECEVPLARAAVGWVLATAAAAVLALATARTAATAITLDAHVATLALAVGSAAAAVLAAGTTLLVLGAGARAAGRRWRAVEAAAARLTPRLLRRALVVGLSAGLTGLAAPALADTPPALGWQVTEDAATPGDGATGSEPARGDGGSAAATAVADVRPGPSTAEPRTVLVRPGDCLWTIAAEHLPAGADDAAIARAWPAWYAANATTIGADPDLLLPGQRLVVPDEVDA